VIDISLLTKNHEIFKPEKDITFKGKKTIDTIVILLKGHAHQTLTLNNKRKILIKHSELSYIGLEEVLMHSPHDHQITVIAGSEYLIYTQTEFLLLFQVQLNVTFDSIIYLCKQLRIHNSQGKKDKKITKTQTLLDESNADEDLEEILYNISFSDADNIPLYSAITGNLRSANGLYLVDGAENVGFTDDISSVKLQSKPYLNGKWLILGFNLQNKKSLNKIFNYKLF
jgi:hypothetical protein